MMDMAPPTTATTATKPVETDPSCYLSARQVRRLCGGVCDDTLRRWRRRTELNFPTPTVINRHYYWKRSAIEQWLADRSEAV